VAQGLNTELETIIPAQMSCQIDSIPIAIKITKLCPDANIDLNPKCSPANFQIVASRKNE